MTLSELRYIVAVARERHFGKAADYCCVSQPTLSVAVKKLEQELDVALFERGQGEVNITPAGQRIVIQAQRALEQVELIREMAKEGKDQLSTPLRLAAIYTIGPYLFPGLVPLLNRRAPQMPLYIEENYTAVLSSQLKRGEQDAIIISLPFDEPGIEIQPLYHEPFVVLLPAKHPWTKQRKIDLDELGNERVLLLGAGHCFRDQVLAACPGCLKPSSGTVGNFEGGSLETMRYMVASGLGITVLPRTAAGINGLSNEMLVTRPFKGAAPQRTVAIAWRKSFPRPKAIQLLTEVILEAGLDGVSTLRNGGKKQLEPAR
ncbi:MAG: hydrogen peroxide-inducible genes activator [Chromatiaceae bacterium]|nr:hydrogen peroxide-inducible genes activator [Chromatiaceae bacterium]MCP5409010.1 hydrogen peroxide-inducible genes activator [Chromatiaceae bacterium]MCP5441901.1 hydrogen peroxide-inducible genes activator [Chromatiaceae bacterium]